METALLSEHGDCWPLIRTDSKPASMSSMLCLSLFSVPPGPPFFVSSLSFSVFNVLCIFLSFLTPPSVSLQSLWTLHLLVFCFFVCFFLPTPHYLFSLSFFFSLAVSDGSLYSAMSSVTGHAGSIRRTFGSQKLLKTENIWLLSE